jgi:ATP-binding cassette subfamily B multidrug efflux pump
MFVFKDVFLVAGITIVLLVMNWRLTLVSFLIIPFVIFFSVHFSVKARDVFRTLRVKLADINTRFSETIGGIRVIQLFGQERENYRTFAGLNHENYEAGMQQIHLYALFMPIIELLGATGIALIIFYGGGKVVAGAISLGSLVAFLSYMKMFFRPIRDIAEKYNVMQNALASAERIHTILQHDDSESRPAGKTDSRQDALDGIHEIAMEDLSFSYVEGETILHNISFSVKAGESIAFVGPTGSGKTTLINLLIRFYEPRSGRILINGRDIATLDVAALRSKIALVTQDPFLFSGTIRDNIVAGNGTLTDEKLAQIITASNCGFILDKLPHGADTELSEGGTTLSSGERQLISIARALARDPDLIILDEATSYIDSDTERKVQAALSNLMTGRTSILVAHRLSTARSARRIMVLHRHRIIESGTHEELMAHQGFYYKLHQLHR